MKRVINIIILVVVVVLVLGVAKNVIAKTALEGGVKAVTGLDLKVSKFSIGLFSTNVHIKDLKLYNPSEFEERVMVDLPEVLVDYNLSSLFKGKVHLEEVRLNLQEFAVIKNKDGAVNLDAITALGGDGAKKEKAEKPKKESKPMDLQIDVLDLKVGKVTYKDHSSKLGKVTSQSFDARIDERLENITDANALVALIISKALKNTTIGRLADIDVSKYSDMGSKALADGKEAAVEAFAKAKDEVKVDKLKDTAGDLFGSSKEKTGEAVDAAKGELKDLFGGSPFSKKE